MLPLERGRGVYSGRSGIGGGAGIPLGTPVLATAPENGPWDFGRDGSGFFVVGRYVAGTEEMLATVGRFVFSPGATGRGPNFCFGLISNLLKSYGSSSYFERSETLDVVEMVALVVGRSVVCCSGNPFGMRTSVVLLYLSVDLCGTFGVSSVSGGAFGNGLKSGVVGVVAAFGVSAPAALDCMSLESSTVAYCVTDVVTWGTTDDIDCCREFSWTKYFDI